MSSAFTVAMQIAVSQAHPECVVTTSVELQLDVTCGETELEVNLGRLSRACSAAPESCEAEKSAFLVSVGEAIAPDPPVRAADLLPAVRSKEYVGAIPDDARGDFFIQPFVGELLVVWVVDGPTSARSLAPEDLAELQLTAEALRPVAEANIARQAESVGVVTVRGYQVYSGSYYTSSLLLLGSWVAGAAGEGPLYVCVASHDLVLATTKPRAVRRMERAAARLGRANGGLLSSEVYRWEAGVWSVERAGAAPR